MHRADPGGQIHPPPAITDPNPKMPRFTYTARDRSGQSVSAGLEASSRKEALRVLAARGLTPIRLDESAPIPESGNRRPERKPAAAAYLSGIRYPQSEIATAPGPRAAPAVPAGALRSHRQRPVRRRGGAAAQPAPPGARAARALPGAVGAPQRGPAALARHGGVRRGLRLLDGEPHPGGRGHRQPQRRAAAPHPAFHRAAGAAPEAAHGHGLSGVHLLSSRSA